MQPIKSLSFLVLIALISCRPDAGNSVYVDPFIGTDATHFISEWRSEACTYPGAVAPHGIVQLSPETSAPGDYLRGYYYQQDTIRRFSLAEHLSGWPDGSQGKGVIMPFSLPAEQEITLRAARSSFSHAQEKASPGYYQVYLQDSRIQCEFTALVRSGMGIFSFEKTDQQLGLLVSDFNELEVLSDKTLLMTLSAGSGYIGGPAIYLYLLLQFEIPFQAEESDKQVVLRFDDLAGKGSLKFKIGASYTSAENAGLNLEKEIPDWNFNRVRQQSTQLWDRELATVNVKKGLEEDKTMFYTAMYHGALLPINATDVNGEYPGHEVAGELQENEQHYIYYTPWDAFRTLYPMINWLKPEKGRDYMRSLVRIYKINGRLPEPEVMTSVHISAMVADAVAQGINDFDVETAFQGLSEMILEPPYFRPDMHLYDSLGYIPSPHRYATTATLEFAFNDWAMARIAEYLGKDDLAARLYQRSMNYKNNFNHHTRFMQSREYDGSWSEASIYAEADEWNMSWFVPHDTRGLINLMGGDEAFSEHLNRNFAEGHFILDNECPMNFPFLFAHAGKPWKTMEWKNKSLRYFFNTSPGGIPGNDDWGTMSSWLAWGMLGFFPATPGTDELVITGPVFEEVEINWPGGKKLKLIANDVSDENIYVKLCLMNGEPHDHSFVTGSELQQGGEMIFKFTDKPEQEWGTSAPFPYSLTSEPAKIELISLLSDQQKVSSNQPFNLNITLQNNGAEGSYPLSLTVNDELLTEKMIRVEAGETLQYQLPLTLYADGPAVLKAEEKSEIILVNGIDLSDNQAFNFEAPVIDPLIELGDSLHYQVRVKNVSGFIKSVAPVMKLDNGHTETLATVTLKPGEEINLQGTIPPLAGSGAYQMSFNNGPATYFRVYNQPEETLVLHYNFNLPGDKVRDLSGFSNHGTIVGKIDFVTGIDGQGIRVDSAAYVKIADSPSLHIEDEELTMICWYKPANEDGKASLITKGGHNMMKLNGKWQLQLAIGGWGVGQASYNVAYNPATQQPAWLNQWSHFAGIRRNDTLQVYYNGELVAHLPVTGKIGPTDFGWRVGSNSEIPIGRTPDGVIDEVMIFARALPAEAIQKIYAQKSIKLASKSP